MDDIVGEFKEKSNYIQEDNRFNILPVKGAELLPIKEAYEKYEWVKEHLRKASEGYLLWIKKPIKMPISSCFLISSKGVEQKPTNLIVMEKGSEASIRTLCAAESIDLSSKHVGFTKVVLKEGAKLTMEHVHNWGKRDFVVSSTVLEMERGSRVFYKYKSLSPPKRFLVRSVGNIMEDAKLDTTIALRGRRSEARIFEYYNLLGKGADAVIKLRIVGDEGSDVEARSKITASADYTHGHLDCQGLLLSNRSRIDLIPELEALNKKSTLTHEAAIGRITEDAVNYLRTRGLSEERATDLIVTGFLELSSVEEFFYRRT
ncbi:MAG: SufD family Fe-S cluster assembly protein [Candidatus Asgardarchaeia archaeon]